MDEIRAGVDRQLAQFIDGRSEALIKIDPHLAPVAAAISQYVLSGGKRFRPIFAYLGYLGAGGQPSEKVLRACSALELVHVCALIHDDLMDGSDSRRNLPSIHKRFAALHSSASYQGDAPRFGAAAAILLGDLALAWSDQLLAQAELDGSIKERCLPVFYAMREELMAGQYLDVLAGAIADSDLDRALKVATLKSGRYSIERPLHFGAALVGAAHSLTKTYSDYGLPLGQAFQLRDDLLGVFGDPAVTGKPAGDDIREGKRTVLIALTMERASVSQRAEVTAALGDSELTSENVERIRAIIEECGARHETERLIEDRFQDAAGAIEAGGFPPEIASAFSSMAIIATKRSS